MTGEISDATARTLASLGVDAAELPDDPNRWTAAAADAVIDMEVTLTADDVAEQVGLHVEAVIFLYSNLGITVPASDVVLFTDADTELVAALHESIEGPLAADEGANILRVAARSLAAIAEAGVAETRQQVERRQETYDELVIASAMMARTGMRLGAGLGTVFRHHLRQATQRQRVGQQGVAARELMAVAVGFVDIVGFTGRTRDMPVSELVRVVSVLDERSAALTSGREVRVVKLIGDEVMFTGVDPIDTYEYARDLIAAFTAEARGGIAFGEVLFRHGDYFGPVVNLASRLVDQAVPGEILVDESMSRVEGVPVEPAGRRMLHGFDEPVPVFTISAD